MGGKKTDQFLNRENKKLMFQSHCDSKPREAKKFKDIG